MFALPPQIHSVMIACRPGLRLTKLSSQTREDSERAAMPAGGRSFEVLLVGVTVNTATKPVLGRDEELQAADSGLRAAEQGAG